jgi:hypothetical protein
VSRYSGGGSPVHIHAHTQNTKNRIIHDNKKKKCGKCGPCPIFASYTLEFALQLRKKHRKTSVGVVKKCPDIPVAVVRYTLHSNSTQNNIVRQNTQNGTYRMPEHRTEHTECQNTQNRTYKMPDHRMEHTNCQNTQNGTYRMPEHRTEHTKCQNTQNGTYRMPEHRERNIQNARTQNGTYKMPEYTERNIQNARTQNGTYKMPEHTEQNIHYDRIHGTERTYIIWFH